MKTQTVTLWRLSASFLLGRINEGEGYTGAAYIIKRRCKDREGLPLFREIYPKQSVTFWRFPRW